MGVDNAKALKISSTQDDRNDFCIEQRTEHFENG